MALAVILGSGLTTCIFAQTRPPATADSLISAAFNRYAGKWYRSLTFVQQTIRFHPDGKSDTAVWYEAYQAPGRLRIDITPLDQGSMYLFTDDSQYVFQQDTLASTRPTIHPLLLLGFDMYFLPPAQTAAKLRELGFDLQTVRTDRWHDMPVVVVGAAAGDTSTAQFWLDSERLLFVRMIMPRGGSIQEVRFNRYRRLEGGWIAPEVVFSVDGRIVMKELYSDIRTGRAFDSRFFDPVLWKSARHWHP